MKISSVVFALTLGFLAASAFAAAPAPTDAVGLQKVGATSATPSAPVAAKKMHCPKGEHRVNGKCVK